VPPTRPFGHIRGGSGDLKNNKRLSLVVPPPADGSLADASSPTHHHFMPISASHVAHSRRTSSTPSGIERLSSLHSRGPRSPAPASDASWGQQQGQTSPVDRSKARPRAQDSNSIFGRLQLTTLHATTLSLWGPLSLAAVLVVLVAVLVAVSLSLWPLHQRFHVFVFYVSVC
jgi:hypothetical protein